MWVIMGFLLVVLWDFYWWVVVDDLMVVVGNCESLDFQSLHWRVVMVVVGGFGML